MALTMASKATSSGQTNFLRRKTHAYWKDTIFARWFEG